MGLAGYPASLFARPRFGGRGCGRFSRFRFQQAGHFLLRSPPSGGRSGAHLAGTGADGARKPSPITVDRDEVFLIEDWRLRPDGTAMAPAPIQGRDAALHDHGKNSQDVTARTHDRLRLRFIMRANDLYPIKIENYDVRVMGWTTSLPNRSRRQRRRVLAPGPADVFVDATAPAGTTIIDPAA